MKKKNPFLKGRKVKTMRRDVLRLLERYNRLMRAEQNVWRRMEAIVDRIVRRELNRLIASDITFRDVTWDTEVDPSALEITVRFTIRTRGKRHRDPKSGNQVLWTAMDRILGREILPAIQHAIGKKAWHDVDVN